uniref:Phosphatidate phosphatase APP1 catalytic domain-containing protein n=1 Tax=Globisporangium ultimum (strain ATCC 200006 / CBS 805.95 / DAOM BR144) TaxID=431595 RepID=K3X1H4_GLOUD
MPLERQQVTQTSTVPPSHQILQIQRMKVQSSSKKRNSSTGSSSNGNNEPVPNALVMVGMIFSGLMLGLLVMAFFAYAPFLCASWLGIMYVVGLYLSTESNWWWHDAQEFENRFWTFTAFMFSSALLYVKDSPFAVGRWNSGVGMFLVFFFTSGVHFFDRFIHRKEISRKPRVNQPSTFSQNLFKYKATAEEKAQLVTESVAKIDRIYLPSTINNMINLSEVRRHEQKIFRILTGASKDELNFILNNIRLALLFYKVKDHSKLRSDQSRTLILDLLCSTRLADLTVTSRAILLDALMVMKLSAHPMCEKWVRNIILKTAGDDLSNLKTYTDAKGDFHSMHKLVFNDIRDPTIRADILNHIKREAGVQTAHMRLGTKRARERRQQAWRKVLSDVDDTLYSSGGRYPAGLDTRFPRHTVYPGVLSFYREMDMGTAGPDEWTDDRVGNLVFLSARPHVYKDMSEKKSYAKFAALYEKKGMHTLPTMLAGNLKSGRAFMVQGDLEPMARKKFENFSEYYQLYPEFKHVFVGDNGQADIRAAELIVEKFGSEALEAGFFHLVHPIEKTFGYHSKADIEKWRSMNIIFFNTYVGAAVEAFKMKKLRLGGLKKICDEAKVTFEEITSWVAPADRERARLLMNTDLQNANELFAKQKSGFEPIALIEKPQLFALNSQVRTPFGRGIIRKFRPVDGIYHVELVDWSARNKKRVRAFVPEESIVPFVNGDFTQIAKSEVKYIKFKKAPLARIFTPQTPVKTPFGNGRVLKFRLDDEIYMVAIDSGEGNTALNMTGYFAADAVIALNSDGVAIGSSPRMFSGVRSGLGYITKKLVNFVPGTSSSVAVKPVFAIGSSVESPFGRGVVIQFRAVDRVYELQLLRSEIAIGGVYVQEKCLKESTVSPPRSFLSMLGLGSGGKPTTSSPQLQMMPVESGSRVVTSYGNGIVRKYRASDEIYEVVLTEWSLAGSHEVVAYLTKACVQQVASTLDDIPLLTLSTKIPSSASPPNSSSGGIFQLFRYGFSSSTSTEVVIRVPYADEGASRRVKTVFGDATTDMQQSYQGVFKVTFDNPHLDGAIGYIQENGIEVFPPRVRKNTLELFGNPFSYLRWSSVSNGDVSGEYPISATPFREPLYPKGSLVVTSFGEGVVRQYRPEDNIYAVALSPSMVGFFTASSLQRPVRGVVGMPVNTLFGSGMLQEVRESDGVHVVSLRHALMNTMEISAFLQPSSVTRALKAARGDIVTTPYGKGVILFYRSEDDFYCVALEWGDRHDGKSHVLAFIRERDLVRSGPVEKNSSGCVVM